jgi:hypothetical protein
LDTKIALKRLSQVVKFSASKVDDSWAGSSSFDEFKSSYDPDLINKAKMSALISLLKSQISQLPQDANTELLLAKIDSIDNEIRKPNPHWGIIFSTLFVLFGFTADLKTLDPDVYEKPFETIETILQTAHKEGMVETQRKTSGLLQSPQRKAPEANQNVISNSREDELFTEDET